MPLNQQQISELDIASQRVAAGQGQSQDQANIDYAMENFGYSYNPQNQDTGLSNAVTPELDDINVEEGESSILPNGGQSTLSQTADSLFSRELSGFERWLIDSQERREQENERQLALQKTQTEASLLDYKDAQNPEESKLELFKRLREEEGIVKQEKAIQDIMSQIRDRQELLKQEKAGLSGRGATMKFIRGTQANLEEKANADITSLTSAGKLLQDNLNSATKLVENYYNLTIQDRDDEIARRKFLYELDNDNYLKLTDEQKELNNNRISILTDLNSRQENEKGAITQLMLQNPTAWQKAAGVLDLTASFDDIAKQLLPFMSAEELAKQRRSGASVKDSEYTKAIKGYAAEAAGLESLGSQEERDAAFESLVNTAVLESNGTLNYNTAQQAIIRQMQADQGIPVTYGVGGDNPGSNDQPEIPDEGDDNTNSSNFLSFFSNPNPTEEERRAKAEEFNEKANKYFKDVFTGERGRQKANTRKTQGEEREEFLASLDTEEKIKQARRDGKLSYSGAINELMKLGYSHSEAMSIFNRG